MFGGKPTAVDHELVPTAVFTTPEIGTVGLTEAEARARVRPTLDVYKAELQAAARHTLSGRDERTLMKLRGRRHEPTACSAAISSAIRAAEIVQASPSP